MTGTYVTDITHFLDDSGDLAAGMPSPARKLASFLVLIIDAVTQTAPAHDHDTQIHCRMEACTGSIRASLAQPQQEISWCCPDCEHNGVIKNWQGTKWDRMSL
jgi:hypothetical protein